MTHTATFGGLAACTDMDNITANIAIIGIPHGTPYDSSRPGHFAGGSRGHSTSVRQIREYAGSLIQSINQGSLTEHEIKTIIRLKRIVC